MRRTRNTHPAGTLRQPMLIAHRGSSGTAPENTLFAFRQAVEAGAEMIELDIRLTRDGALVVLHDQRVARTTNGRGRVRDLPLDAIRTLDAGSWYGSAFHGEPVPGLYDVLRKIPRRIGLNIEVKTDGDRHRRTLLARTLCGYLDRGQSPRTVLVSSFDRTFLKRMKSVCPATNVGVLYMPVRDLGRTPSSLCRPLGATTFICSRRQLRKRYVVDARQNGLAVFVYGINRPAHLQKALRYGVDGIMTDYPEKIRHRKELP
jgi:glycerophosphoryl diester phosphodiesterase